MKHLMKCTFCNKYTLKLICDCGRVTASPKPPKYSPEDKYGEYRRKAKYSELLKKGLL